MTVRLADVIDVLDEAYPPGLAQSWDSVGLVCGDSDNVLRSAFGAELSLRVCAVRTDPWNIDNDTGRDQS
jgi:hypothetical protein